MKRIFPADGTSSRKRRNRFCQEFFMNWFPTQIAKYFWLSRRQRPKRANFEAFLSPLEWRYAIRKFGTVIILTFEFLFPSVFETELVQQVEQFLKFALTIYAESRALSSIKEWSMGLTRVNASSSGVVVRRPAVSPAMTEVWPASIRSTAKAPSLLARIRSRAVGLPPRCMCPR